MKLRPSTSTHVCNRVICHIRAVQTQRHGSSEATDIGTAANSGLHTVVTLVDEAGDGARGDGARGDGARGDGARGIA